MRQSGVFEHPVAEIERGHQIGAMFLHHGDCRIVDVGTVLDRIHARLRRPTNALRSVRVRRDFAAQAMGVGHDGLHLFQRVLRSLRIVAQRKHAAGRADFDQIGAVLDVLANLVLHGEQCRRPRRRRPRDIRKGSMLLSQCPPVMPSAGPLTSIRGPGTSPALIASRRATSVNPLAPTLRTVVNPASSVRRAFLAPISASRGTEIASSVVAEAGIHGQVRVRVDHARQHGRVRQLDAHRIGGNLRVRRGARADDLSVFDDQHLVGEQLAGLHIEQMPRMNHDVSRCLRDTATRQTTHSQHARRLPRHLP